MASRLMYSHVPRGSVHLPTVVVSFTVRCCESKQKALGRSLGTCLNCCQSKQGMGCQQMKKGDSRDAGSRGVPAGLRCVRAE